MRRSLPLLLGGTMVLVSLGTLPGSAQNNYTLDPSWPKMPTGMHFGLDTPPPGPQEREAQAAARRAAQGANAGGQQGQRAGGGGGGEQAAQPGVSGVAIDDTDHVYAFNRGPKTIMVFDRDGNLTRSGGDQPVNGKTLNPSYIHSGAVDREGNVWIIERDAHRLVKFNPTLDKVLMQLGTTGEKGNDATHFNLPSGIAVLRNGNLVITDGYGNNRVVMFDKTGKFIKQVGKGAGGPDDKGTGPGEWVLPHKLATDKDDNMYIIDRENHRLQVYDKNLNYLREIKNDWNPWDVGISRKGDDGFGYIADHQAERVHKFELKTGKIVATWGTQGRGPNEFDWVHGIVVDSKGGVYAADTYGQRIQKFVPGAAKPTASR